MRRQVPNTASAVASSSRVRTYRRNRTSATESIENGTNISASRMFTPSTGCCNDDLKHVGTRDRMSKVYKAVVMYSWLVAAVWSDERFCLYKLDYSIDDDA